ncbi:type I-F CRISPR-associated endoribonuclease Cas6/Csy4 [Ignatzschineria larvae DSM 13226]|uniref:Type I-F CRISPR-associated endoribonuclease Cas6/Csy4 n=1 Tax=Ignatzschineria larvae DSM 13226 TaxID=1111732 RepID=A0ABZ3BY99_9GAMM|nr:type I-F CRISPR-associated endoribonuclease Cas6/Csy4 [Ignatzschineria larvae]
MKYYQEITLIDHVEISPYFILSRVFGQLHLAFVEQKGKDNRVRYGLSFPEYYHEDKKSGLGKKIRIFAETKEELFLLVLPKWLERLSDYVHIQSIKEVPNKIEGYAKYQRYHSKGDVRLEKERRGYAEHYAQQNSVSIEEALSRYSHWERREVNLPYIQIKSLRSDQNFKLFIKKEIVSVDSDNSFNQLFTTYGLSAGGIVPEF